MKEIRDYLLRGLLFEAEAETYRNAGIRVGADGAEAERNLLEEALAPFDVSVRARAMQMARFYVMLYCFENAVRDLITDRLSEEHGAGWWDHTIPGPPPCPVIPNKVREFAKTRQEAASKDSWLEGERKDPLSFVDFGNLCDIITHNWDRFDDLVPSQHWLKQRMDELEKARNFIAHNRFLLPAEFSRIDMYVSDWNRMVGF